jgi:hypothetical protein
LAADSYARTDFRSPNDLARFAADYLLLFSLPAVLTVLVNEALTGGGDWDEDELMKKVALEHLNMLAGTMVGLRELSVAISGTFGYSGPAGTRFFSEAAKLGKQVQQGEVDEALIRAANSTAGVLFHYPSVQVDKTVRGVAEFADGNAGPQAILFGLPKL